MSTFQSLFYMMQASTSAILDGLFPKKASQSSRTLRNRGRAENAQRTKTGIRIGNTLHANDETLQEIRRLNCYRIGRQSPFEPAALFEYRNTGMKAFLWQIKYYAHEEFIKYAADIWSDELIAACAELHCKNESAKANQELPLNRTLIVHPPSSGYLLGTKTFDQMNLLVETMLRKTALGNFCEYIPNAVEYRQRDDSVMPQHTGSRKERFAWAKQKFALSNHFKECLENPALYKSDGRTGASGCQNIHIICIDDVTTTGATLSAIQDLIRAVRADATVTLSAFAH